MVDDVLPCVVLDPFGGSGTVGLVADRLGRDAILIELNQEYVEMAIKRIKADNPLFSDVEQSANLGPCERVALSSM